MFAGAISYPTHFSLLLTSLPTPSFTSSLVPLAPSLFALASTHISFPLPSPHFIICIIMCSILTSFCCPFFFLLYSLFALILAFTHLSLLLTIPMLLPFPPSFILLSLYLLFYCCLSLFEVSLALSKQSNLTSDSLQICDHSWCPSQNDSGQKSPSDWVGE